MSEVAVPRTSRVAIVALVFSLLFCIPLAPLVGIVLGIVAFVQIGKRPAELTGRGLAIAAFCVGGLTFVMNVGVMAAIAIPNYLKFQSRTKSVECRANLKAMYTAQLAYHQEKDAYSSSMTAIGFAPERGNRYAYFAAQGGPLEDRSGPSFNVGSTEVTGVGVDVFKYGAASSIGVEAVLPFVKPGILGTNATMACAGNIDNDDTLDVWSISTEDRTGLEGERIPRGEPYNHLSDIRE